MNKLTNKQQAFVEEYLVDRNATRAAIRAGYSEKTAKDIACENLAKPNIKGAIQELMTKRSKRTEITADKVLEGIAEIAFAEFNENVNATNKLKAFELLGKHLVLFSERHLVVEERPLKDQPREVLEAELMKRMKRLNLTH